MPKIPDDMSAAAIKRRAAVSDANKANAKEPAVAAPPKPRIAKKR